MTAIMKLYITLLLLCLNISGFACERHMNKTLRDLEEPFNFVTSYYLGRHKSVFKYTAVLSRHTYYQITLAEEHKYSNPQLKLSILNYDGEVIATNESNGMLQSKLNFFIYKTGIYYLRYEWTKELTCGAATLGYYRSKSAKLTQITYNFLPNKSYQVQAVFYTDSGAILKHYSAHTNDNQDFIIDLCYRDQQWNEAIPPQPHYNKLIQKIKKSIKRKYPNAKVDIAWIREV